MPSSTTALLPSSRQSDARCCLSCGAALSKAHRRYCSLICRQTLHRRLNVRTGLLKALNTRFATFYFTPTRIVMDVLPYGSRHIFSYIMNRTEGQTPADDFICMANTLGNAWWKEKNRTRRHYLATQSLLARAVCHQGPLSVVRPTEKRSPVVRRQCLVLLTLDERALEGPDAPRRIRSAFRQAAKRHHPDHGGQPLDFVRLQHAYEHLLQWVQNPVFQRRRGFADKWFYDGLTNRWLQPAPLR
jgi:hypothetical protein